DTGGSRTYERLHAANRDGVGQLAAEALAIELHAWGQAGDVVDRTDALHIHLLFGEGGDGDRHALDVLLAACRGYHNFFQCQGGRLGRLVRSRLGAYATTPIKRPARR